MAKRDPEEVRNKVKRPERRVPEESRRTAERRAPEEGRRSAEQPRAKRDSEKRRRQREQQVRRQIMTILIAVAAALLVVLFFAARGGRGKTAPQTGTGAGNGTAVSGVSENTVGTSEASLPSDAAVPGASEVSSAEPAVTPEPAPLVTKGTIEDGKVSFVNDPAYSEKVTILGTGDNLIHEALFLDARDENGDFDFTPMYRLVKPYVEAADIATVNQETPLATEIGSPSGYPHFNTPTQAGDALIDAGFDAFNLATNHVFDMGEDGLIATLDYWDSVGAPYFGAYRGSEDRSRIRIIEKNGIRVAFLGFVNWTNADPPEEGGYQLVWIDDEESVRSYIEQAKEEADVVVVYAHWGEENENIITEQMSDMAQKMVNWGADVVFGDHTHVLQKITVLQRESDGKLCPVQFCGGNFISGQKERAHLLSVLTTAEFAKNPATGDVVATGLTALPLVTHYIGDRTDVCIYPLDDYTEELAESNGVKQFENETMTLDYMWDLVHAEIPDQFLVHTS